MLYGFEDGAKLPNIISQPHTPSKSTIYEGWNFNSGNYLFTTDTK